jgi:hypothetical protein
MGLRGVVPVGLVGAAPCALETLDIKGIGG